MPVSHFDGAFTFRLNSVVVIDATYQHPHLHQLQKPNPRQEFCLASANSASFSASCLLKPSPFFLFKHLTQGRKSECIPPYLYSHQRCTLSITFEGGW